MRTTWLAPSSTDSEQSLARPSVKSNQRPLKGRRVDFTICRRLGPRQITSTRIRSKSLSSTSNQLISRIDLTEDSLCGPKAVFL